MEIRNKLLKFNTIDVFNGIKKVYGQTLFNEFVSYMNETHDFYKTYTETDLIDFDKEELMLCVRVFFDSEDKRFLAEIGFKDRNNKNLLDWLENMERYKIKIPKELFVFSIKLKNNKTYYIGKNFQFIPLTKHTTFEEIEKNAKLYSHKGAKILCSIIWNKKRWKIEKEFGSYLDRTSYCSLEYLTRHFKVCSLLI